MSGKRRWIPFPTPVPCPRLSLLVKAGSGTEEAEAIYQVVVRYEVLGQEEEEEEMVEVKGEEVEVVEASLEEVIFL